MTKKGILFKIGTRESALAMVQANSVKEQLKTLFPENEFEIVGMTTKGDKNLNMALPKMGKLLHAYFTFARLYFDLMVIKICVDYES